MSAIQTSRTVFTSAQIAAALGRRRQEVQRDLTGNSSSMTVIVRGNPACAWELSALPASLQTELEASANKLGYRNALHLLSAPPGSWQPEIPLRDIAPECLDKAARLMRALSPTLSRINHQFPSEAEFEASGLEDYRREFGYSISARHWRELLRRTLERDRGAEQWDRIEIYLDEKLARKPSGSVGTTNARHELDFAELSRFISSFEKIAAPSRDEERLLWVRVLELYNDRTQAGDSPKATKQALVEFLFSKVPCLAKTEAALDKMFRRKLQRWVESDQDAKALKDQRNGRPRWPGVTDDDKDKIVYHAVFNCGGRIAQAWRELAQGMVEGVRLNEDLLTYYLHNPANLSYVPAKVLHSVKYDIRMLEDLHHGPRQNKLNGAHIFRDWSKVYAGDWWNADDVTLPVYYFVPDGNGWYTLMRGQVLIFIDLRSTRILGFSLQSERNYNSRVIRTLITRCCDEHGLPRKGFYFEMGIWKSSKILKGDSNADIAPFTEAELGLREFGLKFVHAQLPRGKPIERVIGALQNLMEREPGYAGRDERHDRYERFQKMKLEIESKKVSPIGKLYNEEQWEARFTEICEQYNSTVQQGQMTAGFSPDQAFEQFQNPNDPPAKFDACCRYLLAHHKRPVTVTANGITLRFGKQTFNYRNEATGQMIGRRMLAWFNPELPDVLAVTDLERKNPICIERTQFVPAMSEDTTILEQELARINEQQAYVKARYRTLKTKVAMQFRRNVVGAETVEVGRTIDQQSESIRLSQTSRERKLRQIAAAGIPTSSRMIRNPDAVIEAQSDEQRIRERILSRMQSAKQPGTIQGAQ